MTKKMPEPKCCVTCGKIIPVTKNNWYRYHNVHYCNQVCKKPNYKKMAETQRRYKKPNVEKQEKSYFRYLLTGRYGVKETWYDEKYAEQNGECAICREPIEYKSRLTHIDHNHDTGQVRGLLCLKCNTQRVGLIETFNRFKKTPWYDITIKYLNEHELD